MNFLFFMLLSLIFAPLYQVISPPFRNLLFRGWHIPCQPHFLNIVKELAFSSIFFIFVFTSFSGNNYLLS
jgi:hypothetical protein